jgi:hypothetical protein
MSTQATPVQLVIEHGQSCERLWGELVRPGVARVAGISHFCDLSHGDLVKVSPLCSCGELFEQYQAGQRVFRGSRRVQFFTSGTSKARMRKVAAYLLTWPGGQTKQLQVPGYVGSDFGADGFPCGVAAYPHEDEEYPESLTHWRISFPWPTSKRKAARFLDGVPHLEFHELMPEGEE